MDKSTRNTLAVLQEVEQINAALRDGDRSQEPAARELLKRIIDASDGPKLRFWLEGFAMVLSITAKAAGGKEDHGPKPT